MSVQKLEESNLTNISFIELIKLNEISNLNRMNLNSIIAYEQHRHMQLKYGKEEMKTLKRLNKN